MTEHDEIAESILKHFGSFAGDRDSARLLTTRYCGTPVDIGHTQHEAVTDALVASMARYRQPPTSSQKSD